MPEPKYTYRLPPCPAYDVEGMEAWLEDMASEGLMLTADGFFLGFAGFERRKPDHKVRYRLEARKYGKFLEDTSDPSDEAIELGEAYGWEYVARRGDFYIYRSARPDARELNTDPSVQALALNAVRKDRRGVIFSIIMWWLIIPLFHMSLSIVRTALALGTPLFLLGVVLFAWWLVAAIREFLHLNRLYRRLRDGEPLERRKNWRSAALRNRVLRLLRPALLVLWLALVGILVLMSVDDARPIADYPGDAPFATVADLADGDYSRSNYGFSNDYTVRTDPLADSIEWSEIALVTDSGDIVFSGSLDVEYYDTVSPIIARAIAREMLLYDRWRNDAGEELPLPDLGVDYAAAYYSHGSEVAVFVSGDKVIRARLLQYSGSELPLEEWTRIVADSIKQ